MVFQELEAKWKAYPSVSLARSLEPLHDSVARTNAGPGKSRAMTMRNVSTSMGRGRGTLHPIPKTKPGHLHRGIDTPLAS